MTLRLPSLKLVVLLLAGLVIAALLCAWLALPGLIQSQAPRYVLERSGHHLRLGRPEIHPFAMEVRIPALQLTTPDGQPLLGFSVLDVRIAPLSLLRGPLTIESLRLDGPQLDVQLLADGRLNWSPLIDAFKSRTPPTPEDAARPPPAILIRSLMLNAGRVDVTDVPLGQHAELAPIDFSVANLATTGDSQGNFRLAGNSSLGGNFALAGKLGLQPVAAAGTLDIEGLDLLRLQPAVERLSPLRGLAGQLAVSTRYQLGYADGRLSLALDEIGLGLRKLRLLTAAQDGILVSADALDARKGRFALAPQRFELGTFTIDGLHADLPRHAAPPVPLALGRFEVDAVAVDLAQHSASVQGVRLDKGELRVERGHDGRIDLQEAIATLTQAGTKGAPASAQAGTKGAPASAHAGAGASATAASTPAPAPWHYTLDTLALEGFTLGLKDESVRPAGEFEVTQLAARVSGISDHMDRALPFDARFEVRSGGHFEARGKVVPATPSAELEFKLANLSLLPAQPYISPYALVRLRSGSLSTQGEVVYGPAKTRFKGGFSLDRLRIEDAAAPAARSVAASATADASATSPSDTALGRAADAPLLGIASLSTTSLTATPAKLDIRELVLAGLDTELLIEKDKTINMKRILPPKGGGEAAPAGAKPGPTAGPAVRSGGTPVAGARGSAAGPAGAGTTTPAFLVNLDTLRVRDGALFFSDQSLALPFATQIHDLHGSINGLSTRPNARGQIQLDGAVDKYGEARAAGQVDLYDPTGFTDIKVNFKNVEMTGLTPYSATFAGRRIKSGKLSLDLDYKINKRQLEGNNRVVMDRLVLGERVDTPGATSLPLDLAIALLQDSDGVIDLGLPVSGSLDDPKFSYGGLIWKALVNVVEKIVLSPFRALGSLFGAGSGGGEKFESLGFVPGSASLSPPEREKLAQVAAAFAKRPGLALTIPSVYAEADRSVLQDLQLRRTLAVRAGQQVAADEDPGPVATRSPKVQRALEALYAERLGAPALAQLRQGYAARLGKDAAVSTDDQFNAELLQQLRSREAVDDSTLQQLARTRADGLIAGLTAAGMPAARLQAGAPAKVELKDEVVPAKLVPGAATATDARSAPAAPSPPAPPATSSQLFPSPRLQARGTFALIASEAVP